MNRTRVSALALVSACLTVVGMGTASATNAVATSAKTGADTAVCPATTGNDARCFAHVISNPAFSGPFPTPTGYTRSDLRSAYNIPATGGKGQTIAIVDAYDDPTAESDLAFYRSTFGLQPCTTANGCFRKVDENGGTNYPKVNSGWDIEISIDVQTASAVCPNCNILLVEASTTQIDDLGTGVNTAVALGAKVVSNSYGATEDQNDRAKYDALYYDHPGVAVVAASGDSGYAHTFYPSSSPFVTAVGGTSLTRDSSARGWSETVWAGTGSGCSTKETAKPSWQTDPGCANRTMADVAADADPATGVAVYFTSGGSAAWWEYGGTSVASPIIAGMYALAGNAASLDAASSTYSHPADLNDVTSGSDGKCGNYLCEGVVGYDGPTGNGTPNGVGAF